MNTATNNMHLYYFYDALCGWCFGFSPVITQVRENFQTKLDFEIISGGLALGERAGPIGLVAPYIKAGAYKEVERRCGVSFGKAFVEGPLEEGTMILNSLPPAIALSIVKQHHPDKAFEFGSLLHEAIYVEGVHPEDIEGYAPYAERIGMDSATFIAYLSDPKFEALAKQDFELTQRMGIGGFPSLVGIKNDSAYVISRGYESFPAIEAKLHSFLA